MKGRFFMQKNKKKTFNKIRVFALETITVLAIILWSLSICAMDSDTILPTIVLVVTTIWLTLIYVANADRIRADEDLEDEE